MSLQLSFSSECQVKGERGGGGRGIPRASAALFRSFRSFDWSILSRRVADNESVSRRISASFRSIEEELKSSSRRGASLFYELRRLKRFNLGRFHLSSFQAQALTNWRLCVRLLRALIAFLSSFSNSSSSCWWLFLIVSAEKLATPAGGKQEPRLRLPRFRFSARGWKKIHFQYLFTPRSTFEKLRTASRKLSTV